MLKKDFLVLTEINVDLNTNYRFKQYNILYINSMEFIDENKLKNITYESYPFPHVVIDNFLKDDTINNVLLNINNLKDHEANVIFTDQYSPYEYNKYAFSKNYGEYLEKLFMELNSPEFIKHLENITGIKGLVSNDISLEGDVPHNTVWYPHISV